MNEVSRQRHRCRLFIRSAIAPGGNSLSGFEQCVQDEGDKQFSLQPRACRSLIGLFEVPQLNQGLESFKGQFNLPASAVQLHHRLGGNGVRQCREYKYVAGSLQGFRADLRSAALALSLHTTDAALRARLLPHAPRFAPQELVELGERYARATGYPIQYQWTLLAGINDSREEIERVADWLTGKYAMMNLIPFNAVEDAVFQRPAPEHAAELIALLRRRGIVACLRDSAGQDIEGACGQLRARYGKAP